MIQIALLFGRRIPSRPPGMSPNEYLFWYLLPCAASIIYLIYARRKYRKKNKYWVDGYFPIGLELSENNLLMAHVAIAALFIHRDKSLLIAKYGYFNYYFRQHFPKYYGQYKPAFHEAYLNPVEPFSLAKWLVLKLSREELEKVLRFMAELGAYDGRIQPAEYDLLTLFSVEFGFGAQWIENFEEDQRNSNGPKAFKEFALGKWFKILGINPGADIAAIKSSYRELVKRFHPDRFQKEEISVQQAATAKFLEIHEAYEKLTKNYVK